MTENNSEAIAKVPGKYYCRFHIDLKPNIVYGVEIIRNNRYRIEEYIDLNVMITYEDESTKLDYVSDEVIRQNSLYSRM